MATDTKEKYTDKQKRKAEHIENSYEEKGVSHKKAEQIAWATVNKQEKNEPDALENQSMKTLIEKARAKYISGRSTMNKVELIQALRRS